ncbi:MAG: hypothetical protein OXT65_01105 [Alphaproteobacteria bacterium]|nr:hypothetical protein [Alphaproteobacteria bacterium]
MTEEMTRYYPRFSRDGDYDKLINFYEGHPHQSILKRNAPLIKKMIDEGTVIMLENKDGDIIAASVTYPYAAKNAAGNDNVKWQEVGTLRSAVGGFGLVDALVSLQTLRTFLVEPPSDRFIARMDDAPVQKMGKRLGFREFAPVKEVFNLKAAMVPEDAHAPKHENWYQLGIEGMPVVAQAAAKLLDNPVLQNKRTGEKIMLDFSRSNFCRRFGEEIRALAAADLGDIEKPDMSKGIRREQKNLIAHFYH